MPENNESKVIMRLLYLKTERERNLGRVLTIREIAKACGVTVQTVSRWLSGNHPDYDIERRICEYFGVDIGDLLTIERNDAPAPLPEDEV